MKDNEAVNFNLHDRAVFISGGAGDIGEVIVKTFVAQKSKVVIADLDGEKAEALAQKYGSWERPYDICFKPINETWRFLCRLDTLEKSCE